ncbi:MAG: hypothetical protein HEP71_23545 [Roseivirga sp.]|nr:hypothetical protein [Roseivirga sp.]
MKTQPNLILCLSLVLVSCFLASCSSDDTPVDQFTAQDLSLMHSDSEKTWRITAFYTHYDQRTLHPFNDCYVDDQYTFKADTEDVEAMLGQQGCYWDAPEQAVATVSYSFNPDNGRITLNHGRGEGQGDDFASNFFFIQLQELSDTRMLFADDIDGRLVRAIEFEKVN